MIRLFTAALAALTLMSSSVHAQEAARLEIYNIADLAFATSDDTLTGATADDIAARTWISSGPELSATARPRARPAGLLQRQILAELPTTLKDASDLTCLAVTIYHEARGETPEGQAAVASVVMQRVIVPDRWGDTVCDVTVPVQFSYLNKDLSFAPIKDYDAWILALEIATVAIVEGPDPWLEGADHYHTEAVDPKWNKKMPVVDRIGFHIFYADPISKAVMG